MSEYGHGVVERKSMVPDGEGEIVQNVPNICRQSTQSTAKSTLTDTQVCPVGMNRSAFAE